MAEEEIPINNEQNDSFNVIVEALKNLSINNAQYFSADDSEYGVRLHSAFNNIIDNVEKIEPMVHEIYQIVQYYDLDEKTPGNGFRSFLTTVNSSISFTIQICRKVCFKRDNILFRKSNVTREVESCNELLETMFTCAEHVITLTKWCPRGELFPKDEHSPEELLSKQRNINQCCFYGRCLGFQPIKNSVQLLLEIFVSKMAWKEDIAIIILILADIECLFFIVTPENLFCFKYVKKSLLVKCQTLKEDKIENILDYIRLMYCESIRSTLKIISLSMAIFSEAYYDTGSFLSKATNSVWTSGKYVLDPDMRARRIVNISQNADVDFCKAFWFLAESELMMQLPTIVSPAVAVNQVIAIPPEPLEYTQSDGTIINIPIPSVYLGTKPLHVRLISHVARKGMVGTSSLKTNVFPVCSGLIVHCHGGGFVAQSSRSHEIYLRDWAQQLDVPILSVDYSLAPDAPFPRAIEEVFYAYCWAMKNCHLLGSEGKTIILAGDSAGGNLCIAVTMKCIEMGVTPPSGLFLAYVPVLVEFKPSPSRLLCIMDPLLPFGFMMRCLKAYACPDFNGYDRAESNGNQNGALSSDTESFEEVSESDLLELQAHKSPLSETSDTLTNVSLSSQPLSTSSKPSEQTLPDPKADKAASEKYVSEFLETYVLDSDTDSNGTRIPVLQTSTSQSTSTETKTLVEQSFQQRFVGFVGAITEKLTTWKNKKRYSPAQLFLDCDKQKNLVDEFKFTVPRDPYLSPYYATDDILKFMPPVRILTIELDPCLDDCIMFGKKLKKLGKDVQIDILPGLPHGFLNFSMISKEAHQGSRLCVQRIKELLDMDIVEDSTDN